MSDKNESQKEDHLSPSPIPSLKEKAVNPNIPLNDVELNKKLELYARAGGSLEQAFAIKRIQENYRKETKDLGGNRVQQDAHYSQGARSQLPHPHHDRIKIMREEQDEKRRNETLKDAKEVYNQGENLKKEFNESKLIQDWAKEAFKGSKNKGQDKDR